MRKVVLYSLLLVGGLAVAQFLPTDNPGLHWTIRVLTMVALSFIMIHVGYEFELDKSRPRQYGWDYFVAFTAAAFPWVFCTLYFVFVMSPSTLWGEGELWKEMLLQARFASPTSAGVLFAMLAAAGLAATWVFRKARILAIFDDLDTILLMIPLKMAMVGFRWQLAVVVLVIVMLLWMAWRYLHRLRAPTTWPWVIGYSVAIAASSEVIYILSKAIDQTVPLHLEVLLPAFVLGAMLARPVNHDVHRNDALADHEHGPASAGEQRVSTIVSSVFMVLVGLSMPAIRGPQDGAMAAEVGTQASAASSLVASNTSFPGWDWIAIHVLAITVLSNLGKMFPAFVYRREAHWRQRLAVAIGMWPRGEVGAGVLVISISYGIGGPVLTVAALSLAVNLLLTGVFILIVKRLLLAVPEPDAISVATAPAPPAVP